MFDPGNAGWQRDVSVSLEKVGDVRRAAGDRAGALSAYEEGLAIGASSPVPIPAMTYGRSTSCWICGGWAPYPTRRGRAPPCARRSPFWKRSRATTGSPAPKRIGRSCYATRWRSCRRKPPRRGDRGKFDEGRDTEIEHLRRVLAEAQAGHGQVVAVVGEAGVGKS